LIDMDAMVDRCSSCGIEASATERCQACQIVNLAASTLAAAFASPSSKAVVTRAPVVLPALTGVLAAMCSFTLAIVWELG
jgi:hypothetical protein